MNLQIGLHSLSRIRFHLFCNLVTCKWNTKLNFKILRTNYLVVVVVSYRLVAPVHLYGHPVPVVAGADLLVRQPEPKPYSKQCWPPWSLCYDPGPPYLWMFSSLRHCPPPLLSASPVSPNGTRILTTSPVCGTAATTPVSQLPFTCPLSRTSVTASPK